MQELSFIVNLSSGGGLGKRLIEALEALISTGDLNAKVYPVGPSAVEIDLSQAWCSKIVFLCGGDGTVAKSLEQALSSKAKLGILPLGTGNDLARELGLERFTDTSSLEAVIKKILAGTIQEVDVWEVSFEGQEQETILFINYLSIGFDPLVVKDFHKLRANLEKRSIQGKYLNRLLYALAGSKNILGFKSFKARFQSNNSDLTDFGPSLSLLVTNIKSYMGLGSSNLVGKVDDGKIELVNVYSSMNYLGMISSRCFLPKLLGSFEFLELSNFSRPVIIQADGEVLDFKGFSKVSVRKVGKVEIFSK